MIARVCATLMALIVLTTTTHADKTKNAALAEGIASIKAAMNKNDAKRLFGKVCDHGMCVGFNLARSETSSFTMTVVMTVLFASGQEAIGTIVDEGFTGVASSSSLHHMGWPAAPQPSFHATRQSIYDEFLLETIGILVGLAHKEPDGKTSADL